MKIFFFQNGINLGCARYTPRSAYIPSIYLVYTMFLTQGGSEWRQPHSSLEQSIILDFKGFTNHFLFGVLLINCLFSELLESAGHVDAKHPAIASYTIVLCCIVQLILLCLDCICHSSVGEKISIFVLSLSHWSFLWSVIELKGIYHRPISPSSSAFKLSTIICWVLHLLLRLWSSGAGKSVNIITVEFCSFCWGYEVQMLTNL